jgi:ribonuclease HII
MLKSSFTNNLIEAGCDEVGRGCLAGPVVAAAVILPKDYYSRDLTDSKLLNRTKREALRDEIKKEAIDFQISEVSNEEIDRINILRASFLAMHQAVDKLRTRPELLLIDGNRFNPYPGIPHKCIIKGDSKLFSIAAASVLAKTHRDELMAELGLDFPMYGWETNVGYPTKHHREAIAKFGATPFHRQSFQLLPVVQVEMFKDSKT